MTTEKEKRAIDFLKTFQPAELPYYGCYSGGKDSDTIYILSKLAGVNIQWHHNLTTVDAPETVSYVRSHIDISIDKPNKTMWQLIEEKGMPPTRLARYCCEELKEKGGNGYLKVTGVRWDESIKRLENADKIKILGKQKDTLKLADNAGAEYKVNKQGGVLLNLDNDESRRLVEQCYRTRQTLINPIVDWTDVDVWEFLNHYGCQSNPLYQCGFLRIGCIGCPMANKTRKKEFNRYPKYREMYIHAFDRIIIKAKSRGWKMSWNSGEECFYWWMNEDINQYTLESLGLFNTVTI